jgi:uncharacterized protein (DUF1810 family)
MWYIFPQIGGLGFSEMSKRYAISDLLEASAYLAHPVLGKRLKEISAALLLLRTNNANQVMGSPDDLKLRSSMTLFAQVPGADPVFAAVRQKYFQGENDKATLHCCKANVFQLLSFASFSATARSMLTLTLSGFASVNAR